MYLFYLKCLSTNREEERYKIMVGKGHRIDLWVLDVPQGEFQSH